MLEGIIASCAVVYAVLATRRPETAGSGFGLFGPKWGAKDQEPFIRSVPTTTERGERLGRVEMQTDNHAGKGEVRVG
jgi:hypothetical protein